MFRAALVVIASLFSLSISANQNEFNMQLSAGKWIGIGEDLNYNVLEISSDGNHKFTSVMIATGLRKSRAHDFSNQNISCNSYRCIVEITNKYESNSNIKLLITPHLSDSYHVLKIAVDNKNEPISSQPYALHKIERSQMASNYFRKYKDRIIAEQENPSQGVYGLWVGVADNGIRKQLAVLNVSQEGQSEFVVFINDSASQMEAEFNSNEDLINNTDVIQITTKHPTFANKLILQMLTKTQVKGHSYSYRKGVSLGGESFTLYKVGY